mgnify:FL=1
MIVGGLFAWESRMAFLYPIFSRRDVIVGGLLAWESWVWRWCPTLSMKCGLYLA